MDTSQVLEMLKYLSSETEMFDALVIDEAQVIGPSLYEWAMAYLNESRYIYIFGDGNQNWVESDIYFGMRNFSLLDIFGSKERVELDINCRSTKEIVEFSNLLVGSKLVGLGNESGVEFLPVNIMRAESEDWVEITAATIADWIQKFAIDIHDVTLLVEPTRMYEGIWGDQAGNSRFEANETGLTFHDGFAIDWWSGPGWAMSRSGINLLTKGKNYLPSGFDEPGEIGDRIRASFSPMMAINRSLQDNAILEESWHRYRKQVEEITIPVVTATIIRDFQGMESKAVIVLNPIPSQMKYLEERYAMATRARVLLAIIVDTQSALWLNDAGVISGFA